MCISTDDGLIPVLIYVRVPVVRYVFAFSRPFIFLLIHFLSLLQLPFARCFLIFFEEHVG